MTNRIAPPLIAPYNGPYKVIVRSGRVIKILVKGKVETVSLDRVKPAHLDNEPAIGTEKQRKTQTNTKNSKNTVTVQREPALKQNSEKKRAELKAKTQTRSVAVQHGTNLATTSQHNANRGNLPNSNETTKCSKQFEYRQRRPNCTRRNRKTNKSWTKNPDSSTFRAVGPCFSSA